MLRSCEKSISRKKNASSIEKFPSLVLPGNTRTVTAPCYPISSLLSISCRLREVKNKRKFQTFCSKRKRERGGRLQDVPNVVIWPKNVWYFGKLVAEERRSQLEVPLPQVNMVTRITRITRKPHISIIIHW